MEQWNKIKKKKNNNQIKNKISTNDYYADEVSTFLVIL